MITSRSRCTPREPGEGFEFKSTIVGGAIPKEYIPKVEVGIKEAMQKMLDALPDTHRIFINTTLPAQ